MLWLLLKVLLLGQEGLLLLEMQLLLELLLLQEMLLLCVGELLLLQGEGCLCWLGGLRHCLGLGHLLVSRLSLRCPERPR